MFFSLKLYAIYNSYVMECKYTVQLDMSELKVKTILLFSSGVRLQGSPHYFWLQLVIPKVQYSACSILTNLQNNEPSKLWTFEIMLQMFGLQWNLIIKRSDITKPFYNKVILLVPALYISLFFYPDIMRNLI